MCSRYDLTSCRSSKVHADVLAVGAVGLVVGDVGGVHDRVEDDVHVHEVAVSGHILLSFGEGVREVLHFQVVDVLEYVGDGLPRAAVGMNGEGVQLADPDLPEGGAGGAGGDVVAVHRGLELLAARTTLGGLQGDGDSRLVAAAAGAGGLGGLLGVSVDGQGVVVGVLAVREHVPLVQLLAPLPLVSHYQGYQLEVAYVPQGEEDVVVLAVEVGLVRVAPLAVPGADQRLVVGEDLGHVHLVLLHELLGRVAEEHSSVGVTVALLMLMDLEQELVGVGPRRQEEEVLGDGVALEDDGEGPGDGVVELEGVLVRGREQPPLGKGLDLGSLLGSFLGDQFGGLDAGGAQLDVEELGRGRREAEELAEVGDLEEVLVASVLQGADDVHLADDLHPPVRGRHPVGHQDLLQGLLGDLGEDPGLVLPLPAVLQRPGDVTVVHDKVVHALQVLVQVLVDAAPEDGEPDDHGADFVLGHEPGVAVALRQVDLLVERHVRARPELQDLVRPVGDPRLQRGAVVEAEAGDGLFAGADDWHDVAAVAGKDVTRAQVLDPVAGESVLAR